MAQIKSILFSEILRQKWFYIYTQNYIQCLFQIKSLVIYGGSEDESSTTTIVFLWMMGVDKGCVL